MRSAKVEPVELWTLDGQGGSGDSQEKGRGAFIQETMVLGGHAGMSGSCHASVGACRRWHRIQTPPPPSGGSWGQDKGLAATEFSVKAQGVDAGSPRPHKIHPGTTTGSSPELSTGQYGGSCCALGWQPSRAAKLSLPSEWEKKGPPVPQQHPLQGLCPGTMPQASLGLCHQSGFFVGRASAGFLAGACKSGCQGLLESASVAVSVRLWWHFLSVPPPSIGSG